MMPHRSIFSQSSFPMMSICKTYICFCATSGTGPRDQLIGQGFRRQRGAAHYRAPGMHRNRHHAALPPPSRGAAYLVLKTIRALLKSYGVSSTLTLSPGRIRM